MIMIVANVFSAVYIIQWCI